MQKKQKKKNLIILLYALQPGQVKIICNSSCHTVDRFMLLLLRLTFEAWSKCLQEASFNFDLRTFQKTMTIRLGLCSPSVTC